MARNRSSVIGNRTATGNTMLLCAAALMVASCASQGPPPEDTLPQQYDGGSLASLLEGEGEPDMHYVEAGVEYLGYRIRQGESYCHALYTVHDEEIVSIDFIGRFCKRNKVGSRVNVAAKNIIGKSVPDVLYTFGVPKLLDVNDGDGTIFYEHGQHHATSGPIGSGNVTGAIGIGLSCNIEIRVSDWEVTTAETSGGYCWADRVGRERE